MKYFREGRRRAAFALHTHAPSIGQPIRVPGPADPQRLKDAGVLELPQHVRGVEEVRLLEVVALDAAHEPRRRGRELTCGEE